MAHFYPQVRKKHQPESLWPPESDYDRTPNENSPQVSRHAWGYNKLPPNPSSYLNDYSAVRSIINTSPTPMRSRHVEGSTPNYATQARPSHPDMLPTGYGSLSTYLTGTAPWEGPPAPLERMAPDLSFGDSPASTNQTLYMDGHEVGHIVIPHDNLYEQQDQQAPQGERYVQEYQANEQYVEAKHDKQVDEQYIEMEDDDQADEQYIDANDDKQADESEINDKIDDPELDQIPKDQLSFACYNYIMRFKRSDDGHERFIKIMAVLERHAGYPERIRYCFAKLAVQGKPMEDMHTNFEGILLPGMAWLARNVSYKQLLARVSEVRTVLYMEYEQLAIGRMIHPILL